MKRSILLLSLVLSLGASSTAGASGSVPLLPPLPQNRLVDQARQLTRHGGPVRPAPLFRSGFVAEASDGYKVGVSTYGSALYLAVWRGGKMQRTTTNYLARGVARPERLQATFGKFGAVSMRFRPARGQEPTKRCRFGRLFLKQRGLFLGSLRFRGEDGYVSVRLHRAKGAVVRVGKRCRVRRRSLFDPADFLALFAKPEAAMLTMSRDGVDSTALLAIQFKKSTFITVHEESRGKLAIVRIAIARKPGKLDFNEALTSGQLTAPRPFHGTGRYRAFPDGSNTWSGNLSVTFPGFPRFPLTGPSFETLVEVPF